MQTVYVYHSCKILLCVIVREKYIPVKSFPSPMREGFDVLEQLNATMLVAFLQSALLLAFSVALTAISFTEINKNFIHSFFLMSWRLLVCKAYKKNLELFLKVPTNENGILLLARAGRAHYKSCLHRNSLKNIGIYLFVA